jgi:hypothetical protein
MTPGRCRAPISSRVTSAESPRRFGPSPVAEHPLGNDRGKRSGALARRPASAWEVPRGVFAGYPAAFGCALRLSPRTPAELKANLPQLDVCSMPAAPAPGPTSLSDLSDTCVGQVAGLTGTGAGAAPLSGPVRRRSRARSRVAGSPRCPRRSCRSSRRGASARRDTRGCSRCPRGSGSPARWPRRRPPRP